MLNLTKSDFLAMSGSVTSAVSVVTTTDIDGRRFGMTASSVTTLTWERPSMLVCIKRDNPTAQAVERAGSFGISVLAANQMHLARHFASPSDNKFLDVPWTTDLLGVPLLEGSVAHIECEVVQTHTYDTHTIFIGTVRSGETFDESPLVYLRGGFGGFESQENREAYAEIRRWILSGRWGTHTRTAGDIAAALDLDPASVYSSMTRLTKEGLAQRVAGGYEASTLEQHAVADAFRTREILECGVIRTSLTTAPQRQLAEVRRRFNEMAELMIGDTLADVDTFFDSNYAFHLAIIQIAECTATEAAFERLGTHQMTKWFHASTRESSRRFIDVQGEIAHYIERRDVLAAEDAIRRYTVMAHDRVCQLLPAN